MLSSDFWAGPFGPSLARVISTSDEQPGFRRGQAVAPDTR